MPLPILLYPLFNLSLIKPRDTIGRGVGVVMLRFLGIWRGGGERGVPAGSGVAFGETGFDLDHGGGEEDGFLLEAC